MKYKWTRTSCLFRQIQQTEPNSQYLGQLERTLELDYNYLFSLRQGLQKMTVGITGLEENSGRYAGMKNPLGNPTVCPVCRGRSTEFSQLYTDVHNLVMYLVGFTAMCSFKHVFPAFQFSFEGWQLFHGFYSERKKVSVWISPAIKAYAKHSLQRYFFCFATGNWTKKKHRFTYLFQSCLQCRLFCSYLVVLKR